MALAVVLSCCCRRSAAELAFGTDTVVAVAPASLRSPKAGAHWPKFADEADAATAAASVALVGFCARSAGDKFVR